MSRILQKINKSSCFELFEESFPGLKNKIDRYEHLGFSWGGYGRLFIKEEKGIALSHVAFLKRLVFIEGKRYILGVLHAICTKAAHRKKGFASTLIKEALKWAEKNQIL
jgi:GNAT superfamily N-acetyltransferase